MNSVPPPTDADLARAAQRGDKKAFVEIVARHQALVCGVALGVLHDFAASEDTAQEAFLTAWRKIQELRDAERLRPWLAQIARNAALGQLRRRKGTANLEEAEEIADEGLLPDEVAASREEEALVEDALAKLPESYRVPLVLFYRQDQSVQAVAEALHLSEDAVKQRLSRGREMLRKRMSGVIESVLLHSRASAIFTMTIAAAIGALAAPAAIASGVFASVATTSTTPIVTAMTTSKLSLTTAAVIAVACLPLGYAVRVSTEPFAALPPQTAESVKSREPAQPLTFDDSLLFAEWRKLHDTHGHDAAAMPGLFKAIADLKDPFRRRAFRAALLAEWAMVDPAGGLSFFGSPGQDGSQRTSLFKEWFAREPAAALTGLMQSGSGWEGIAETMLTDIAQQLPGQIPMLAERLPKPDNYWSRSITAAFAIMAEKDVAAARTAAESLAGPNREQALAGVAKTWAKTDPEAAIAWAKALPNSVDREEIIRGALLGTATVKPTEALDRVSLVPPGGRDGYFATTTGARVLQEACKADFDGTIAWLIAHPRRLGHEDMLGMASAVTERMNADPAGFLTQRLHDQSLLSILPAIESALLNNAKGTIPTIWEWLKSQPADASLQPLRERILHTDQRSFALQLAREAPAGAEGEEMLQTLASGLLNGGSRLGHLDGLLKEAPERLRAALLATSFNGLREDTFTDAAPWLARLEQLTPEQKGRATSVLAGTWASKDPTAALNWVQSLPSSSERTAALQKAVSGWTAQDSLAASGWADQLPAGPDRDTASVGLVSALAEDSPEEAWQWALNISDHQQQLGAVMQTLRQVSIKDPAAVARYLQNPRFTKQERIEIQMFLEKNSPAFIR